MIGVIKKTLFVVSFLNIVFVFFNPIPVNAATCAWIAKSTSYETGYNNPTIRGGCNDNQTLSDIKNCTSKRPVGVADRGGMVEYECCCNAAANSGEVKETLFTMPDFQVQIPGLNKLAEVTCKEGEVCAIPWIGEYTKGIYNYLIAIVGVIASIVLMGAGVIWITSGGDSGKINQAKDLILGAIVGLVILATSYLLLKQINPNLVNLKDVDIDSVKKVSFYGDAEFTGTSGPKTYQDACTASKSGDWSLCRAYKETPPQGLGSIESVKANAEVAKKYLAAMECVKKKNGKYLFYIREGWRSPLKQIEYKEISNKNGGEPVTADPCCSNHGPGHALDINRLDGGSMSWTFNETSGLKACMNEQGLWAKLNPEEPWHWSKTGF